MPPLTAEQAAELEDAVTPVDPDAEAAPDPETADAPPSGDEETDAASASEPAAEPPKKVPPPADETEEQKAAREKQEQIDKRWSVHEAAKKQQLANGKVRQELTLREEKVAAREAQLDAKWQSVEREIAAARRYSDMVAEVRANPTLEGLRALGFDYRDLTQKFVEANTPEAIARDAAQRTRQLEEQLSQRQQVEADRSVAQNLLRFIEENEADHADALVLLSPEQIAEEGLVLKKAYERKHHQSPTYGWVASRLQAIAKQERDEQNARSAKRAGGASREPASNAAPNNGHGGPATRTPNGKPTLTNAAGATRVTPAREMTEAEKDDWALQELRNTFGKGKAPARQ